MLEIASEEEIRQLFYFTCEKDEDIEKFLKEKSIDFEKTGKSRTYFIYDEDADNFKILAYYTIALQVLSVPEEFSNRMLKKFDGLYAKSKGKRQLNFPAILLGQLGKNDLYSDSINGNEIMQFCLSTILDGQEKISGRIILLECKSVPYLISLYKSFGFELLDKEYSDDELLQFVRILAEEEIIPRLP